MPTVVVVGCCQDRDEDTAAIRDAYTRLLGAGVVTAAPGGDEPAIVAAVRRVKAVVAVIGPRWLGTEARAGCTPECPARSCVSAALRLRRHVVPLLLRRGVVPEADALPPELARLPETQAFLVFDPTSLAEVAVSARSFAIAARERRHTLWRQAIGVGAAALALAAFLVSH